MCSSAQRWPGPQVATPVCEKRLGKGDAVWVGFFVGGSRKGEGVLAASVFAVREETWTSALSE